jgi:hypothetical protein
MILVRDVFRLKFGKAREGVALMQEGLTFIRRGEEMRGARALTDLAGPSYYTLVLESTYDDLAAFERSMATGMADPEWRAWYGRFTAVVESGHRELFNVVGSEVPTLGRADAGHMEVRLG